jgi:hypothetical protein
MVSVPTVLCVTSAGMAVGVECTCDHSDGEMCPMHHSRSKTAAPTSPSCACRSTNDPMVAVAAFLFGHVAELRPMPSIAEPADAGGWLASLNPEPLEFSSVPDSPPPRA